MRNYDEAMDDRGDSLPELENKEGPGSWFSVFGDVDDFIFYRGEEADEYRSAR